MGSSNQRPASMAKVVVATTVALSFISFWGGAYVVVRDSIGPFTAKLSVSALVVDYILTGPISSVTAGQYLGHLFNEVSGMLGQPLHVNPNYFAAAFGIAVTGY